ncbi:hypothetical protein Q8F55_007255 [Vanrija albida]|uniref:ferric-chelate reductase (NADPH) n=1 Tax=Vanrija albida TaxID=181172 RepID=A0ABR3PZ81_9TREE
MAISPDSAVKRQDGSLHLAPSDAAVGTPLSNVPSDVAFTGANVGTPLQATPTAHVGTPLNANPTGGVGTPLAVTATGGPAPSQAWNQTKYEIEHQAYLDEVTPRNLMIACTALLGVLILISHPRFLARLFSSVHRRKAARAEAASRPAYAFDMETAKVLATHQQLQAAATRERVVAGGDLDRGWILKKGSAGRRAHVGGADAVFANDDNDPFASASHDPNAPMNVLLSPPPHIVPLASRLPFARWLEAAPFSRLPSFAATRANVMTITVIVIYIFFCVFALAYQSRVLPPKKGHGYGNDFQRSGLVAMSQIPVAIALGVRGNIIGLTVGKGYDRLRIFHKVVGRIVFIGSLLHTVLYMHKFYKLGKLASMSAQPIMIYGYVAFAGACLLVVSSLPVFRRAMYSTFQQCHFLGVLAMLVGLGLHVPIAKPWMIASAAIYAFSMVMSAFKTRFARAELVAVGGCTTTLITIPELTTGWRAGQHVRLRVFGIGVSKIFEAHPFTIASAPDSGGLVLMAKAVGDWTEALYELAASGEGAQRDTSDPELGVWKRRAMVMVEGPYGGLGHTLPTSFSSLILMAGGSGITHSLALAQDIIQRSPSGVVAARTVDLVWVVRVEQTARAILPSITALVSQARAWERKALAARKRRKDVAMPTALRVHIFVTRVPHSSPLTLVPGGHDRYSREKAPKLHPSSHGHGRSDSADSTSDNGETVDAHAWRSNDGHGSSDGGHGNDIELEKYADWSDEGHGHVNVVYTQAQTAERGQVGTDVPIDNMTAWPAGGAASRPAPAPATAAEKERADWLVRNASIGKVAMLRARRTDPNEPMSSLTAYRGRPEVSSILCSVIDESISRHGRVMTEPSGVFVSACGPEHLVNDSRDAVRGVAPWKRTAVGGVDFESEFFGF